LWRRPRPRLGCGAKERKVPYENFARRFQCKGREGGREDISKPIIGNGVYMKPVMITGSE
jgi:hypothetical protein